MPRPFSASSSQPDFNENSNHESEASSSPEAETSCPTLAPEWSSYSLLTVDMEITMEVDLKGGFLEPINDVNSIYETQASPIPEAEASCSTLAAGASWYFPTVSGKNVPPTINSFEKCGLKQIVIDNIMKIQYSSPTLIQRVSLPIIVKGRDLMVCAPTCSGKTASFLLPIISTLLEEKKEAIVVAGTAQPQAVIMLPTRELAIQIWTEARKLTYGTTIKTCITFEGTASNFQANDIRRGCHILVSTAGILIDFIEKHYLSMEAVMYLVLDEIDKMIDKGFMEHIDKIMTHPTTTEKGIRQTLMFSARYPESVQHMAALYLSDCIFVTIGIIGGACADVEQVFYDVEKFSKKKKIEEVLKNFPAQQTVIFVETNGTADYIGIYIRENLDVTVCTIHGGKSKQEREIALSDFESGNCSILVATAVATHDLDIKNVTHVINYDLPKSTDDYFNRIIRVEGLENRGKATSLFDSSRDSSMAADLCKILTQAGQPIPDFLKSSRRSI